MFTNQQKKISQHFLQLLLLLSFTLFLISCETLPGSSGKQINADWNSTTNTLTVSGKTTETEGTIEIINADNDTLIGNAIIRSSGEWAATSTIPACQLKINSVSGVATINVKGSPDCGNSSNTASRRISQRDLPIGTRVVGNPTQNNAIPNAVILSPVVDITILTGDTINFQGIALGGEIAPPYGYHWNFDGASPNSAMQNPGLKQFNTPGTYFVRLTVTDNLGVPDPTPATRTIIVQDPNTPVAAAPIPEITSPSMLMGGDITIGIGQSLFFSGIATDPAGSTDFLYEWDFSGAVPNKFGPSPGDIIFNQAGMFVISLYATDTVGNRSLIPATVSIVVEANGVNQTPTGSIIEPLNDVVINVGDTLVFTALGMDPDMNLPLSYSWDFQGAAANIDMSPLPTTAPIAFTTPGIYNIKMFVNDALGAADANPPIRVVTVQAPVQPPPTTGMISTQITSPPNSIKILPGESIFFSGEVIGNIDTQTVQFLWDFNGAAVNSNLQTPGDITFSLPGKYRVTFSILDSLGNLIGTMDNVKVKVRDPSKVEVEIESPSRKDFIQTDIPVLLDGKIEHQYGATDLSFEWSIVDVTSMLEIYSSTMLLPGTYTFVDPGMYQVSLRMNGIDILGTAFERTDMNVINVTAPTPVLPMPPATGPAPAPAPTPIPIVTGSAILMPAGSELVQLGDSIMFEANAVTGTNITYLWTFSAMAPPSDLAIPPAVIFDAVGDYLVTLTIAAMDNTGAMVAVSDERLITVMPPVVPASPVPVTEGIISPLNDLVITEGDSVNFRGSSVPNTPISYLWNFAGVAPNSIYQNPSPIQFNTVGSYLVTLKMTGRDSAGNAVNIFSQRAITVLPLIPPAPIPAGSSVPPPPPVAPAPGVPNTTPDATIVEPAYPYVIIKVGESINFNGAGFDPYGTGSLTFVWSFGGSAATLATQSPGTITFNIVGVHVVTLLVQNSLGQFDPTPATVVITVVP